LALSALIRASIKKRARGVFTYIGDRYDDGRRDLKISFDQQFINAVKDNPSCIVGLSALLTTTMAAMEETVKAIKEASPETKTIIGGAPITQSFAEKIGADIYSQDPQDAVDFLNSIAA